MILLVTGELAGGSGAVWTGFLIDLVVKGTLLLMAAHLLARLLYNARPATRSRTWNAFLLLLLLVPVTSVVSPSRDSGDPDRSWLGWEPVVTVVQVEPSGSPASTAQSGEPVYAVTHGAVVSVVAAPEAAGEIPPSANASRLPWEVAAVLWFAGFIALTTWMLIRLGASWIAVRRTAPFPGERAARLWREVCDDGESSRVPEIRLAHDATVPYLTGVFRPRLVLPEAATAWPMDRLRMVVLHEFAHLRRRDLARLVLGDLVASVFWFHPLAWWAIRKAALEQEMACDEEVCRRTARRIDYARLLVSFASAPISRPGLAAPGGLELRTRQILAAARPAGESRSRRSPVGRWFRVVSATSVFAACLYLLATVLVRPEFWMPEPTFPSSTAPIETTSIEKPLPSISIHAAAAAGDREAVARLVQADPQLLDQPDHKGMTPLALAAWNMHLELVEDLLVLGADPDRKNHNGLTPLFCAMDRDRPRLTRILLEAGADPSTRGYRNWTLLHMAARNGDWETAQILVQAGLDVNARDAGGSTPLNYVHRYRTAEVGRILLAAGAEEGAAPDPPPLYKEKIKRRDA